MMSRPEHDEQSSSRSSSPPANRCEYSAGCVFVRLSGGRREALVMRVRREGYELPKGHLEADETAEAAAVRELREETGLQSPVKLGAELGAIKYSFESNGATITKRVRYFHAAAGDDALVVFGPKPKRTRELRWVTSAELTAIALVRESLRAIVAKGLVVSQGA